MIPASSKDSMAFNVIVSILCKLILKMYLHLDKRVFPGYWPLSGLEIMFTTFQMLSLSSLLQKMGNDQGICLHMIPEQSHKPLLLYYYLSHDCLNSFKSPSSNTYCHFLISSASSYLISSFKNFAANSFVLKITNTDPLNMYSFVALSLYDLIWKLNTTLKITHYVNTTVPNVITI